MNPVTVAIVGIGIFLCLILLRMPVALAMALVGFVGTAFLIAVEPALKFLSITIFERFSSYPLSVIPMFVLMGSFAFASGIGRRLFITANAWGGALNGGLTVATVLACAGFSAVCGSSPATAATMGKIALPEMKRYHYDDALSTGTVAAAGSLGILLPPSTVFIVYGVLTEQSIGKLFLAGIMPGVLLTLLFALTVIVLCFYNPDLAPAGDATKWRQKVRALTGVIEVAILFVGTIGGLFLGWFSPTQAGAVGATGALIIGLARQELNWQTFYQASVDGLRTSCMILFIITGAIIFGQFLAVARVPFLLADWVGGLPLPPVAIIGVILFIYFIGGLFMDSMALVVLTVPIFFPVIRKLGVDPIWFGVMIVLLAEIGVITPPVGVNVFVIKGVAPEIPLVTIFKGILPFLGALIVCAFILMAFPQITTFLPNLLSRR